MFAYARSIKGKKMDVNDDAFITEELGDFMILMVADGNGGRPGMPCIGRIACGIVMDFIEKAVNNKPDITVGEMQPVLDAAFYSASRTFRVLNAVDRRFENVYASLACMVISTISHRMILASTGNCEVQMWRKLKFSRLNRLHTEAFRKLESSKIQERDYYIDPGRNLLTSALGYIDQPDVDILPGALKEGDVLLFVSDGVFQFLNPDDILAALSEKDSPTDGVDAVLDKLAENEEAENCTLMCLYVD